MNRNTIAIVGKVRGSLHFLHILDLVNEVMLKDRPFLRPNLNLEAQSEFLQNR